MRVLEPRVEIEETGYTKEESEDAHVAVLDGLRGGEEMISKRGRLRT